MSVFHISICISVFQPLNIAILYAFTCILSYYLHYTHHYCIVPTNQQRTHLFMITFLFCFIMFLFILSRLISLRISVYRILTRFLMLMCDTKSTSCSKLSTYQIKPHLQSALHFVLSNLQSLLHYLYRTSVICLHITNLCTIYAIFSFSFMYTT